MYFKGMKLHEIEALGPAEFAEVMMTSGDWFTAVDMQCEFRISTKKSHTVLATLKSAKKYVVEESDNAGTLKIRVLSISNVRSIDPNSENGLVFRNAVRMHKKGSFFSADDLVTQFKLTRSQADTIIEHAPLTTRKIKCKTESDKHGVTRVKVLEVFKSEDLPVTKRKRSHRELLNLVTGLSR